MSLLLACNRSCDRTLAEVSLHLRTLAVADMTCKSARQFQILWHVMRAIASALACFFFHPIYYLMIAKCMQSLAERMCALMFAGYQ